jgi:hypothetical protein
MAAYSWQVRLEIAITTEAEERTLNAAFADRFRAKPAYTVYLKESRTGARAIAGDLAVPADTPGEALDIAISELRVACDSASVACGELTQAVLDTMDINVQAL